MNSVLVLILIQATDIRLLSLFSCYILECINKRLSVFWYLNFKP